VIEANWAELGLRGSFEGVAGVQAEAEDASNDDQTSANRIKLTIRSLLVRNLVTLLVDTGLENIVCNIVLALS